MFAKLKSCPMCQSTWLSTIIVSLFTIVYSAFFVLAYPIVHIALFHALTNEPRVPTMVSHAEDIVRRYSSSKGEEL